MHFVILTQYFPPEVGAPQTRLWEMGRELRRRGHDVTVVTAMPNYPMGKVLPAYRGKCFLRETMDSIQVIRVWIYPAHGAPAMTRLANYLSFACTSLAGLLKAGRPDYIFVESPPLFLGITGYLGGRIYQVPFILNVSDLWPEWVKVLGFLDNLWLFRQAERLAAFLYRRARYITCVTDGIVQSLKERGVPAAKLLFLPNGVNVDLFTPSPPSEELARRLKLEGEKVFLYAGSMGYAHGAHVVVEAADILKERSDLAFVMVGDGSERAKVVGLAEQKRLPNLQILSPVPLEELPPFFSISRACLVTHTHKLSTRPAKMFPALASAVPVIYSGLGEGAELIRKGDCGLVVRPEDPQALAHAVLTLADDEPFARRLGKHGRKLVEEEFSWERLVGRWLEQLGEREGWG